MLMSTAKKMTVHIIGIITVPTTQQDSVELMIIFEWWPCLAESC